MSAFWTFIQPSSSHFLRFSIIPWIPYHESIIIFSSSPFGIKLRAFTIAISSPLSFVWVDPGILRAWFFVSSSRQNIPAPALALEVFPSRHAPSVYRVHCSCGYECVLVLGFLLPLLVYLGRSLLLFLVLPSPLCLGCKGWTISNLSIGFFPSWCVV